MKKNVFTLLISIFLVFIPGNVNAQFLKKLKNKVENKLNDVLETDDQSSENNNDVTESTDSEYDISENTANYDDFITGNNLIFKDIPANDEVVGEKPSKWIINNTRKTDNSEIIEVSGKKMIRLAKTQGISPLIPGKENDYIPNNFTLEFDAGFSANSLEQRYYINFYDIENQNDLVEYDVRDNELTFTTFGVTDNMTDGTINEGDIFQTTPESVWRHIAMTCKNNELEVYYDGQHIFHKGDIKGNFIGITISRSDFGNDDRYLKNIVLATN